MRFSGAIVASVALTLACFAPSVACVHAKQEPEDIPLPDDSDNDVVQVAAPDSASLPSDDAGLASESGPPEESLLASAGVADLGATVFPITSDASLSVFKDGLDSIASQMAATSQEGKVSEEDGQLRARLRGAEKTDANLKKVAELADQAAQVTRSGCHHKLDEAQINFKKMTAKLRRDLNTCSADIQTCEVDSTRLAGVVEKMKKDMEDEKDRALEYKLRSENAKDELESLRNEVRDLRNRKGDCMHDRIQLNKTEQRLNIEDKELNVMRAQGKAYVVESRKLVAKLDRMLKVSKEESRHKVDNHLLDAEHAKLVKAMHDLRVKEKEVRTEIENEDKLNATNVKLAEEVVLGQKAVEKATQTAAHDAHVVSQSAELAAAREELKNKDLALVAANAKLAAAAVEAKKMEGVKHELLSAVASLNATGTSAVQALLEKSRREAEDLQKKDRELEAARNALTAESADVAKLSKVREQELATAMEELKEKNDDLKTARLSLATETAEVSKLQELERSSISKESNAIEQTREALLGNSQKEMKSLDQANAKFTDVVSIVQGMEGRLANAQELSLRDAELKIKVHDIAELKAKLAATEMVAKEEHQAKKKQEQDTKLLVQAMIKARAENKEMSKHGEELAVALKESHKKVEVEEKDEERLSHALTKVRHGEKYDSVDVQALKEDRAKLTVEDSKIKLAAMKALKIAQAKLAAQSKELQAARANAQTGEKVTTKLAEALKQSQASLKATEQDAVELAKEIEALHKGANLGEVGAKELAEVHTTLAAKERELQQAKKIAQADAHALQIAQEKSRKDIAVWRSQVNASETDAHSLAKELIKERKLARNLTTEEQRLTQAQTIIARKDRDLEELAQALETSRAEVKSMQAKIKPTTHDAEEDDLREAEMKLKAVNRALKIAQDKAANSTHDARQLANVLVKIQAQNQAKDHDLHELAAALAKMQAEEKVKDKDAHELAGALVNIRAEEQVKDKDAHELAGALAKTREEEQVKDKDARELAGALAKVRSEEQAKDNDAHELAEALAKTRAEEQVKDKDARELAVALAKTRADEKTSNNDASKNAKKLTKLVSVPDATNLYAKAEGLLKTKDQELQAVRAKEQTEQKDATHLAEALSSTRSQMQSMKQRLEATDHAARSLAEALAKSKQSKEQQEEKMNQMVSDLKGIRYAHQRPGSNVSDKYKEDAVHLAQALTKSRTELKRAREQMSKEERSMHALVGELNVSQTKLLSTGRRLRLREKELGAVHHKLSEEEKKMKVVASELQVKEVEVQAARELDVRSFSKSTGLTH